MDVGAVGFRFNFWRLQCSVHWESLRSTKFLQQALRAAAGELLPGEDGQRIHRELGATFRVAPVRRRSFEFLWRKHQDIHELEQLAPFAGEFGNWFGIEHEF